ncbi:MAG: MarR family transcriptional regulator, partial [Candidatus Thorarchaeota archaeon]|nr:MarR family transcriptional regulator [Candidatus Thorarchaeota archaeon]
VFAMAALVLTSILFLPVQGDVQLAQLEDVILDPVEIKAIMKQDGVTTINLRARAINQGSTSITSLSFRIDSLNVELLDSEVNGTITSSSSILQDRYTEVIVSLPTQLEENDTVWVEVNLEATDFQSDPRFGFDPTKYYKDFSFYIRPTTEMANFTFTAILPQDALLSRESVVPVFPAADSNFTDGASLAFVWFTDSLQIGQERVFIVKYQYPNAQPGPLGSFLFESILIAVLGVIAGIVLTMGGPKFYQRIKRIGTVRFVGVTSEEEEVLEVIRQKGGSCPQKDLYTEFDMSQAKVSLILNNLEERGLVRRFRDGRENVVHIMEN